MSKSRWGTHFGGTGCQHNNSLLPGLLVAVPSGEVVDSTALGLSLDDFSLLVTLDSEHAVSILADLVGNWISPCVEQLMHGSSPRCEIKSISATSVNKSERETYRNQIERDLCHRMDAGGREA
jgi:hypothetical protein